MSILQIVKEVLTSTATLVIQLSLVIIAIMIVVEFFQAYNLLGRLTALMTPLTRLIGIPKEGNLPLLAGLMLGIGYGGAVIIEAARNNNLTPEEIYLMNLFLVICHSIIEDTAIWLALGAKAIPVQLARLVMAIIICAICSWYLHNIKPVIKNFL